MGKGLHPNSLKNLKKWQKGQSGNPRGRPLVSLQIRASLEAMGLHAIKTIYDLMDSKNEAVSLRAATFVAERILGKDPQKLEIDGNLQVREISDEKRQELLNAIDLLAGKIQP